MQCPACRVEMERLSDRYRCPKCCGEFFLPEAQASNSEVIDEAWFRSMQTYWRAMRNSVETDRWSRIAGFPV